MINIRKGTKSDLPFILNLIIELADYEKAVSEVDISLKQLEKDGFGEKPIFSFKSAIIFVREHQLKKPITLPRQQ